MAKETPLNLFNRFTGAAAALICVIGLGGLGYWVLTGMRHSILDCVYMSVITITTVGFGEVIDLSNNPNARIFTIVLCLSGIGMATYLLSSVTAFIGFSIACSMAPIQSNSPIPWPLYSLRTPTDTM